MLQIHAMKSHDINGQGNALPKFITYVFLTDDEIRRFEKALNQNR